MGDNDFSNRISELRKSKGFTQAYVAEELGVTPAAVSKWESGSSKPRVEVLFKLAQLLEVSTEELMTETVLKKAYLDETEKPKRKLPILKIAVAFLFSLVLVGVGHILIDVLDKVKVPSVTGMNVTEATQLLEELEIQMNKVEVYDEEVEVNIITSQSIKEGKRVDRQTEVTVIVSKGRQPFAVPSADGKTLEEAESIFADPDFEIEIKEKFSETIEKGKIISQTPEAGTMVNTKTAITLTVSKGIDAVEVPLVAGKSELEAKELLKAAGLNLKTSIKCSDTVKEGKIISQDVEAGSIVSRGSWVTATISVGKGYDGNDTNGNDTCTVKVVRQGDWIYYSNTNHDYYLYKMRPDGSEKQPVVKSIITYFCIRDEWIYYSCIDERGREEGIYKIKLDKTENTKLRSTSCSYIHVEDEWVYYADGSFLSSGARLYRMKTDGEEHQSVCSDKIISAVIVDEKIYVALQKDEKLYRMNLDGSNMILFHPYFRVSHMVYSDGKLYAIYGGECIQSINLDGTKFDARYHVDQQMFFSVVDGYYYSFSFIYENVAEKCLMFSKSEFDKILATTEILRTECDYSVINFYMCVVDDWIYFPNYYDDARMYRVKTDGSGTLEPVYI